MRWSCSTHGRDKNACTILVGKLEGRRLVGRSRPKWEDITMYLRGREWKCMD
jgi:hypothetical protein